MGHGRLLRWLATSVVLATVAGLTATAYAATRDTQTYRPKGLSISFKLPSDWLGAPYGKPGWDWGALSPADIATIRVGVVPTTKTFPGFSKTLTASLRASVLRSDPKARVSASRTEIGSVPAVLVAATYRGLSNDGPATMTSYMYGFVRHGRGYLIEFDSKSSYLGQFKPAITLLTKSLKFTN